MKDKTILSSIITLTVGLIAVAVAVIAIDKIERSKSSKIQDIGTENIYENTEYNYVQEETENVYGTEESKSYTVIDTVTTEEAERLEEERNKKRQDKEIEYEGSIDFSGYSTEIEYDKSINEMLLNGMDEEQQEINNKYIKSIAAIADKFEISTSEIIFSRLEYMDDIQAYERVYSIYGGEIWCLYKLDDNIVYYNFVTDGEEGIENYEDTEEM